MQTTKDPFGPKKKTVAFTASGDAALAIRCFPEGGLSVVVMLTSERSYSKGDMIPFKYRADEGDVVSSQAEAFGEKGIEMPNPAQILNDAQHAKVINVRITRPDEVITDAAFNPKGAAKALRQIVTDCPAESTDAKPADDQKKTAPAAK